MGIEGRTALVTGSGRNIGRAVALDLAGRGANVVVNGSGKRDEAEAVAEAVRALGVEALVVIADVGVTEEARRLCAEALARFGRVDVLVNNAAIRPHTDFLDLTFEEWQRVIDVDLNAAFHTAQACLPGMVEQGWGRIVNFAGMNAIDGYQGRAAVSVAKHAVWGLSKALAKEFGPHGVCVNCVSPGPIGTERAGEGEAEAIRRQTSRIPLGRLGRSEEVAAVCGLLASEEGGFVSGQLIAVNGGART